MQGAMSVGDYCRKQKSLVDELTAVGTTILDKGLVLNTLCRLNQHYAHMRTLISMRRPLPSYVLRSHARGTHRRRRV